MGQDIAGACGQLALKGIPATPATTATTATPAQGVERIEHALDIEELVRDPRRASTRKINGGGGGVRVRRDRVDHPFIPPDAATVTSLGLRRIETALAYSARFAALVLCASVLLSKGLRHRGWS